MSRACTALPANYAACFAPIQRKMALAAVDAWGLTRVEPSFGAKCRETKVSTSAAFAALALLASASASVANSLPALSTYLVMVVAMVKLLIIMGTTLVGGGCYSLSRAARKSSFRVLHLVKSQVT
jgi:hypothetical protein